MSECRKTIPDLMSTYELWSKGFFDQAIRKKLIKSKVVFYCEIYQAFKKTRSDGNKYIESLHLTAEAMNVSVHTVKRAVIQVAK